MTSLFYKILDIILQNINIIKNILEIGSSYGKLADIIISNKSDIEYNIIEPNYMGNINNKIIHNDYYENIDDTKINANTLILSHVFEHFYSPKQVLDKIYKNQNIENIILVNPDLEYYINNDVHNVLTTEHTYYIDNNFIVNQLDNYGFKLYNKENHNNHSIIFFFRRYRYNIINKIYKNINYSLDKYYGNIYKKVNEYNQIIINNKHKKIYFWPASIHTLYICDFGLYYDKIYGLLDNSINKIGKKMYGINKIIFSFNDIVNENEPNSIIILNGGLYNEEVLKKLENTSIKIYK
jgi:hypothetical protein